MFARSLAVKPPIAGETLRFDYAGQSFALGDKAVGLLDTLQDFKTAHTFTRASAGSTINAMREIVSVPANEPRFTHDILTGAPLGLLIEEARTRLNTVSLAQQRQRQSLLQPLLTCLFTAQVRLILAVHTATLAGCRSRSYVYTDCGRVDAYTDRAG